VVAAVEDTRTEYVPAISGVMFTYTVLERAATSVAESTYASEAAAFVPAVVAVATPLINAPEVKVPLPAADPEVNAVPVDELTSPRSGATFDDALFEDVATE
jgi:hypothetical protein